MSEWTLTARHVTRSFGQGPTFVTVLRDISLDLGRGEVVLLMGPSGSGKSTLLGVLSGLIRPNEGQVTALGQDLWNLSPELRRAFRLRHCGFIFQGYNLFPSLTAREQLEMVLCWGHGASHGQARRQVNDMLALLGLESKGDLLPHQLSGGEKQRVAIGRALIKNPTFCFADEPTSALDWHHGKGVVEHLQAAARERKATILLVAHEPRIASYADRIFHMEDGQLTGPPQATVSAP